MWYVLKGAPSLGMLPLALQAEGACATFEGLEQRSSKDAHQPQYIWESAERSYSSRK